jgi:hypothetical protein
VTVEARAYRKVRQENPQRAQKKTVLHFCFPSLADFLRELCGDDFSSPRIIVPIAAYNLPRVQEDNQAQ